MPLLYHRVPEGLSGDVLYPLNQLKHLFPNAYRHHVQKYRDRGWLQRRSIPGLAVLWGDALQFSAIHPMSIKKTMAMVGLKFEGEFFVLDAEALDPMFTTVFLYREHVDIDAAFEHQEFDTYRAADVEHWNKIGKATLRHYQEFVALGKAPYPYCLTPHILHAGTITNIESLDRIKI